MTYSSEKKKKNASQKPSISCGRLRDGWMTGNDHYHDVYFGREQQPWQMGQLNHCGNGVLDGWLWISGGHRVTVCPVRELSEEFSMQGFETPFSQALDTDKTGGRDPWNQKEKMFRFISKAHMIKNKTKSPCSLWTAICWKRANVYKRQPCS